MKHLKVLTKKGPQRANINFDVLAAPISQVYAYESQCTRDFCTTVDNIHCSGFSPVTDECGVDYAACSGQFSLDRCANDYAACISGGQSTGRDDCYYDYAGCYQTTDTDCSFHSGGTDTDGCSWEYGADLT